MFKEYFWALSQEPREDLRLPTSQGAAHTHYQQNYRSVLRDDVKFAMKPISRVVAVTKLIFIARRNNVGKGAGDSKAQV